jgi:hypothetical protein
MELIDVLMRAAAARSVSGQQCTYCNRKFKTLSGAETHLENYHGVVRVDGKYYKRTSPKVGRQ